jgi:PhzF family phenazine biosynthesis protein
MLIPLFQVDAFKDGPRSGNPAAVCLLSGWLPDDDLQFIAAQNNLSETAFVVPKGEDYELRWFTPTTEVNLCGHATLAATYVLLEQLAQGRDVVNFESRSGILQGKRESHGAAVTLPVWTPQTIEVDSSFAAAIRAEVIEACHAGEDLLLRVGRAETVQALTPDIDAVAGLDARGVIVTAEGIEADFVSRFFGPRVGVDEDPVTGSAHCALTPFWAERLDRREMVARQLSARGGTLHCRLHDDHVELGGRCGLYLSGFVSLEV